MAYLKGYCLLWKSVKHLNTVSHRWKLVNILYRIKSWQTILQGIFKKCSSSSFSLVLTIFSFSLSLALAQSPLVKHLCRVVSPRPAAVTERYKTLIMPERCVYSPYCFLDQAELYRLVHMTRYGRV